jgi:tryptophanyl-tRNA synthetase
MTSVSQSPHRYDAAAMTRVFSGIQPTGEMQLGNYVGAVRRWVETQPPAGSPAAASHDAIYCVVDLHAMTTAYDPEVLRRRTREVATLLFAAGLDPERSLVFVQSHVGAHAECTWMLNCVATFGELRRMTQFKEKSEGQESVTAGLFDYPVLMAADILLYDTDDVPVGDDQRQHVELTRDLALRFNHRFGETFVIPTATFPTIGARVMDLQQPANKMSKSADSPQGTVLVLDPPEVITKKVKAAVTDSGSEVRYDPEAKPGVSNLLDLYAAATATGREQAEAAFGGSGYGSLKSGVAEAVVELLRPVRERYEEFARDPAEVDRLLGVGAGAAAEISNGVLDRARNACGLLPRPVRR